MTIYDDPPASDGKGGSHPLAGIPQEVLDAAVEALTNARDFGGIDVDDDDLQPIAHSVLISVVKAMQSTKWLPCHVCGSVSGEHECTDGKTRLPLLRASQASRTDDHCYPEDGHHVMPHRGCYLR